MCEREREKMRERQKTNRGREIVGDNSNNY